MTTYQYEVRLEIHQKRDIVSRIFVDKEKMMVWEKGISAIEEEIPTLFETSSSGYLLFSTPNAKMRMKVTVLENNLPESITLIYEVPGVRNTCMNTFLQGIENTIWKMDVTFEFDTVQETPKDVFQKHTLDSMLLFKTFVEQSIG